MNGAGILDRSFLLEQLDGDQELWREIMGIFMEDTPNQIRDLPEAIARTDAPAIQLLAHTLKGASGNVGAAALREAAWQLEQAAANEDLDGAEELFNAVKVEFARVEQAYATPATAPAF